MGQQVGWGPILHKRPRWGDAGNLHFIESLPIIPPVLEARSDSLVVSLAMEGHHEKQWVNNQWTVN